jgi:hypothetical protein
MDVHEVKSMGRTFDKTSCIAQYKLDFSGFTRTCLEHAGAEEEIEVGLRGAQGVTIVLRAFVKASLLKDWQPDMESMNSDLSFMSTGTPKSPHDEDYVDEDDSQVRIAASGPSHPLKVELVLQGPCGAVCRPTGTVTSSKAAHQQRMERLQELPGLGQFQGSSMSLLSDDSENLQARMPSPGHKPALQAALSLDSSVPRSRRTRDTAHERNRSMGVRSHTCQDDTWPLLAQLHCSCPRVPMGT